MSRFAIFDLDGTLVDSDEALVHPFRVLGVDPDTIPFGLPASVACDLAGITLDAYLDAYDDTVVQPFPGVADLLAALPAWAVCSNKARRSGMAELARLRWSPSVALFSEDFGGEPKRLQPVLDALGRAPHEVVFVGDTAHDRTSAAAVGAAFALAGWNPRAEPQPGDVVLSHPGDVLALLTA